MTYQQSAVPIPIETPNQGFTSYQQQIPHVHQNEANNSNTTIMEKIYPITSTSIETTSTSVTSFFKNDSSKKFIKKRNDDQDYTMPKENNVCIKYKL